MLLSGLQHYSNSKTLSTHTSMLGWAASHPSSLCRHAPIVSLSALKVPTASWLGWTNCSRLALMAVHLLRPMSASADSALGAPLSLVAWADSSSRSVRERVVEYAPGELDSNCGQGQFEVGLSQWGWQMAVYAG